MLKNIFKKKKKIKIVYYTKEDKICLQCGNEIQGHCCGTIVIYWCKGCGNNHKKIYV